MEKELAPVVVFIFIDKNRVLLEKRPETDEYYPEGWIFPGERVEESDLNIINSLIREVREEFGVIPLWFTELPQTRPMLSPLGQVMHPFVVSIWDGDIPEKILDNDHEISWHELEEVTNSPIHSVNRLSRDLQDFLNKK